MATYTRANAWKNGGTFNNSDLLWYAKGVHAMQKRRLDEKSSWWFFAAIHGEYVTPASVKANPTSLPWAKIPGPPQVPTTPLPDQNIVKLFWKQCQHQTWYFAPWHRGYLLALEAQIRHVVVALGGPKSWALPYWDYLASKQESAIPPAFTQAHLPDGTANPLFVNARFGLDGLGDNIFVPTKASVGQRGGIVTQSCLANDLYTGHDRITKPPGFGGPKTTFSHGGGQNGNLENNPHNLVHSYVGGADERAGSPTEGIAGLMSDPGTAALDPIFYLHHANIDRLWAAWNQGEKHNPSDPNWLKGPAAGGADEFVMPMPGGKDWVYTPQEMTNLARLDYSYDTLPPAAAAPISLADRVKRLAGPTATIPSAAVARAGGKEVELIGANEQALPITGAGTQTTVKLDPAGRQAVAASLDAATVKEPDRVYLSLENVQGTHDPGVLSVYVNLPAGANPDDHPELLAGSVGLFGLGGASSPGSKHGGTGLAFTLDITDIVDSLHLHKTLQNDSLQVTIVPHKPIPQNAKITVGQLRVYRDSP